MPETAGWCVAPSGAAGDVRGFDRHPEVAIVRDAVDRHGAPAALGQAIDRRTRSADPDAARDERALPDDGDAGVQAARLLAVRRIEVGAVTHDRALADDDFLV